MTQPGRSWEDLRIRAVTGVAVTALAVAAIWVGGLVFALTAALVAGLIVWETARMVSPHARSEARQLGLLSAAALLAAQALPEIWVFPLLAAPALVGAGMLKQHRALFAVFAFGVLLGCFALTWARDDYGAVWLFWLAITVAMTDMAGYFGGKSIGGPKFWPAVSPKKTWAGIVSGWAAALAVAMVFWIVIGAGPAVLWIAVPLSFASQMGDIAESAMKRRLGVKDSSNLLPGHGGLFDRFDGILGGALFMLVAALVFDVSELTL